MAEACAKETASFVPLPAAGDHYDEFICGVTAVMTSRFAKWKKAYRKEGVTGTDAKHKMSIRARKRDLEFVVEAAIEAQLTDEEYASWASSAREHARTVAPV